MTYPARKSILVFIFSLAALFFMSPLYADILHLKSGESLEGQVLSEDDSGVMFSVEGAGVTFTHSEIDRIEHQASTASQARRKTDTTAKTKTTTLEDQKKPFWKKIKLPSYFSSKKSHGSRRSRDQMWTDLAYFLGIHAVLAFLISGLTMKMYFALFGEDDSYWNLLWFQIKVFVIGLLMVMLVGFLVGLVIGLITRKPILETHGLWANILAAVVYTINFYVRARKDLDSGILKTFGLSWVMALTNLAVWKLMERFLNFEHHIPTLFSSYLR